MSANGRAADRTLRGKKAAFLKAFAEELTVSKGAAAAGVGRRTVYEWREKDPGFAEAWNDVDESITEELEREAHRRGVEGFEQPVFQGGKKVGSVRKHSDRLLEMLLRARRPEKYRDNVSIHDDREEAKRRAIERMSEEELDRDLAGLDDNVIPIRRAS